MRLADNGDMTWILAVIFAAFLSGCASSGRLYPIEGPYSKLSPPPIIHVHFTGMKNSGEMEFTLPDGPLCKGEWAAVSGSNVGVGFSGGTTAVGIGTGGASPGAAVITCSDGRRVDIDFTVSSVGAKSGVGNGKDTKGNIYRFML